MIRPYIVDDGQDIPVESQVALSLTMLGITGGMRDEHRAARRLIADLSKVGLVIGDMRAWRRDFLRGHVAGENEDHRLAGLLADQADEIDRLRAVADAARTAIRSGGFPELTDRLAELDAKGATG